MSMFSVSHVWPVLGPTMDGRAGLLTGLLGIFAETGLTLAVFRSEEDEEETSCLFCPSGKQRQNGKRKHRMHVSKMMAEWHQ